MPKHMTLYSDKTGREGTSCRESGVHTIVHAVYRASATHIYTDMMLPTMVSVEVRKARLQHLLKELSTIIEGVSAQVTDSKVLGWSDRVQLTVDITWTKKPHVVCYWWWATLLQRIVCEDHGEFTTIEDALAQSNARNYSIWESYNSAQRCQAIWRAMQHNEFTVKDFNRYRRTSRGPERAYESFISLRART